MSDEIDADFALATPDPLAEPEEPSLATPPRQLRQITSPQGTYTILAPIGSGGLAKTFRAGFVPADGSATKEVCLKRFLYGSATDQLTGESKRQELFRREADVLPALDHPAFPHFHEAFTTEGEFGDETTWIAMEYIPGKTLRQKRTQLTLEQKLAITDALLDAAEHLHTKGFAHRDIKPDNVIVQDDGTVRLVDLNSVALNDDQKTYGSTVAGTSGYAPIEQFQPMRDDKNFAPADVYAVCATMYYLLTGQEPEREKGTDHLILPKEHGQDLCALVQDMTWNVQKNRRIQTATEARSRLRQIRQAREEKRTEALEEKEERHRDKVEYDEMKVARDITGNSFAFPLFLPSWYQLHARGLANPTDKGGMFTTGVNIGFVGGLVIGFGDFAPLLVYTVAYAGLQVMDGLLCALRRKRKRNVVLEGVECDMHRGSFGEKLTSTNTYEGEALQSVISIAELGEGDLEGAIQEFRERMTKLRSATIPSSHFDALRIEYTRKRIENGLGYVYRTLKKLHKDAKKGKREVVEEGITDLERLCEERGIVVENQYEQLREIALRARYKTQLAIVEPEITKDYFSRICYGVDCPADTREGIQTRARALCAEKGIRLDTEVETYLLRQWQEKVDGYIRTRIIRCLSHSVRDLPSSYTANYTENALNAPVFLRVKDSIDGLLRFAEKQGSTQTGELKRCYAIAVEKAKKWVSTVPIQCEISSQLIDEILQAYDLYRTEDGRILRHGEK